MVKDLVFEFAVEYPPFAAIDDEIVHVPASTNVTAPVEALTVQMDVVELE
jgi:hypothetical protein